MKRLYFFVIVLLVAGIANVTGQTNQALTEGQIFTGNLTPNAVHTYRIRIRGDAEYFIAWDDVDTRYTNGDYADVIVGVRGDGWGQYMIEVQDQGNYGQNLHRLVNQSNAKRNPLSAAGSGFASNTEYIVEVRGISDSASGMYRIVFY